ncbi:restriction endonuclease subunit S [Bathymodiolus japonicus methanotrophic gill symbiont]|uniref:restriction endonuclease subunit S n=1 Tax=Bathymodiolus japonicus methanotrophic gill symbiont TaxID=113269 RepID=UPI001C8D2C9E|nr:restriction endonuclease subunit S [Bathymodiolus japonicus methanotrophic gill symbiont]
MQQLFPAESETVPKLRFPEFRDAREWEEKQLVNLISTVIPPKKLLSESYLAEGLYPIIDQSQNYICGWTNDQKAVIADFLPLIIFGDHTCLFKFVTEPFVQGSDGIKILKTNELVESHYLYQFLRFNPLVMESYKRHFSDLKEKQIVFPRKKTGEQQKIADCLSSIDDLITAQSQKIESLKAHKKGMMQQLFPVDNEEYM